MSCLHRRQTAITIFTWLLALVSWILIAVLLISGFDEGIENLKTSGILRLVAFLVPNTFLLLGLVTGCRCLFHPTIFFYKFLTWTLWFLSGYNFWAALLPSVFLSPKLRLELLEDVDEEYDENPDVLEALYWATGLLLASLFTKLVSSILQQHQNPSGEKKKGHFDLEQSTYAPGDY